MLQLLRTRRGYFRLWLGDAISLLGDWLTYVAVSLLALERGHGLLAVAMVLVAHTLPHALLAPLAGWLADRCDRRRLLVGAAVCQGLLTVAMAALAARGALGGVQALLLARVAAGAVVAPASTAALPRLVARHELGLANTLGSATWSITFALGVSLGGVLAGLLGAAIVILLDAFSFFAAALLVAGLPALAPDPQDGHPAPRSLRAAWRMFRDDLGQAASLARRDARVREAVLAKVPVDIANGGAFVLLTASAAEIGGGSATAAALGLLQGARALGTAIGPIVWARAHRRDSRMAWHATALVSFAGVALLAAAPGTWAVVLGTLAWGAGIAANWVAATTRLQEAAPDRLLGRLAALDLFGWTLGACAGALGGALAANAVHEPRASAWLGLGAGVLCWIALHALAHPQRVAARRRAHAARSRVAS